ncbi:HAUS augmin-like complex subunit 5 [Strigops habroptila]|uniref:HAUS augmin-like complex subunit 5 n=1 Tax=Strigops habroptila TaxID=2489341 RepID=UPI0011D02593|nr:HAUS augmin-like complex subunit 5 [Strigops habroptila]
MAALAPELSRWVRVELEPPPGADPPEPGLRRRCVGSCAPIWEFLIRHVRHPRNVKKIKGNLLWYQHLKETQQGAGPSAPYMVVGVALRRLRAELGVVGGAVREAEAAALELEAALGAELSRQGAELRRGAELRALGEAAAREGERLRRGRGRISSAHREPEPKPGTEPEVAAVCRLREEALQELLEPRPLLMPQDRTMLWMQEAKALLNQHSPTEVLGALERLRKGGVAGDPNISPAPDPDLPPNLDPAAPAPAESLIQDCWVTVGELWELVPPLASRLPPLRLRLLQLQHEIHQHLGGDPQAQEAARLVLEAVGLAGARGALTRQSRELRGGPGGSPKPALDPLRRRLQQGKEQLSTRWFRLRALAAANGRLRAQLRPLQDRAQGAARPPPSLQGEGQRLLETLRMMGTGGAPLPPRPAHNPLEPISCALGMATSEPLQGALLRAAALRAELRELQGAGPARGAGPGKPRPPRGHVVGVASAKLLPQLRALSNQTRQRIEDWPRLQDVVSQWWEQPAQWTLAPPPDDVPFSHWLQRWAQATRALGLPRHLPLDTPPSGEEGRGQRKPRP